MGGRERPRILKRLFTILSLKKFAGKWRGMLGFLAHAFLKRNLVFTCILIMFLAIGALQFQGEIVKTKEISANLKKYYQIIYHLTLEKDDYPGVKVKVINALSSTTRFFFWTEGTALDRIGDLRTVFKSMSIRTFKGKTLPWTWKNNEIIVENGHYRNFTIEYFIDALNLGSSSEKYVLFRAKRIFFIAGYVFLLPKSEPSKIAVEFSLPKGTKIFSSLPEENDRFIAKPDLWGNIVYDFQKAYFTGGIPIFNLTHYTQWGDEYIYIWFVDDATEQAWLPSYGNTPWEQADKYMNSIEMFAKYYREKLGPLPQHTVLFTNAIVCDVGEKVFPVIAHIDWFHYMQIWPRYSEGERAHHIFHQYSFWPPQAKLSFNFGSPIGGILNEGLPTYFEQTLPTLLLNESWYKGKLFEFFVLNERGKNSGIEKNYYHRKYNIAALKVYLIDKFIREKTNGKKNITDFARELWNKVKDNKKPRVLSDEEIIEVFAKVVGEFNKKYIVKLANEKEFRRKDFIDLLPYFKEYLNWMSDKYFWGNKLLFLCFLDIVSAKGGNWPHFATYPHNIIRYRRDALIPFKKYLESLKKAHLTQEDVVKALEYVTGKDHSGFFEFWESFGIKLDPNSLLPLNRWNPKEVREEELLSIYLPSTGFLKTEHYLAGIPQHAKIILYQPDDDGVIIVEVRLWSFDNYPSIEEARNTLSGPNVSFMRISRWKYENLFLTSAFFKVTTGDPKRQRFSFNLTLPSFSSHPKFLVDGKVVYWLHSIDPIDFKVKLINGTIILPDTPLDNETYVLKSVKGEVKCKSLDKISIPYPLTVEISLYDKFGFLRARKEINPPAQNHTIIKGQYGNQQKQESLTTEYTYSKPKLIAARAIATGIILAVVIIVIVLWRRAHQGSPKRT